MLVFKVRIDSFSLGIWVSTSDTFKTRKHPLEYYSSEVHLTIERESGSSLKRYKQLDLEIKTMSLILSEFLNLSSWLFCCKQPLEYQKNTYISVNEVCDFPSRTSPQLGLCLCLAWLHCSISHLHFGCHHTFHLISVSC